MRFWHVFSAVVFLAFVVVFAGYAHNVFAAPGTSSIVAYWKFDETSAGSTASDASGYGNNGTTFGSTDKPQPATQVPFTTFPDTRSLQFNGTDD